MNLREVIGGRCSVVSKTGVRYVGTLISIESEQKTLSFEKVMSYGTEGRLGNGRDIPPSNNVFDYIVFKADEITALKLVEPAPTNFSQSSLFYDPAIVGAGNGPMLPTYPVPNVAPSPFSESYGLAHQNVLQSSLPQPSKVPAIPQSALYPTPIPPQNENNASYAQTSSVPSTKQSRNAPRSNNRKVHNHGRSRNAPVLPRGDFDFESFNAQFNKEEVLKEISSGGLETSTGSAPLKDPKNYYDKKTSFFDNISCDSKNKAEGITRERMTPGQGRKTNLETFGENYSSNSYNRYHVNHRSGQRGGPRPKGNRNNSNSQSSANQGQSNSQSSNGRPAGNSRSK